MQLIRTVDAELLYEAIYISFCNDEELVNKYHVVNTGFIDCVESTYNMILETSFKYPCEWYVVVEGKKVIGFTVVSKAYNFLYSFAINKDYRNQERNTEWFKHIGTLLGNNFTCGLWALNTRAVNFLLKQGMEIYKKDGLETHLKYN